MISRTLAAATLLFCAASLPAQRAGMPPDNTQAPLQSTAPPATVKAKRQAPHPLADQAPGGGPDKVWVNLSSAKYHCYGDRYYGRTSSGRYMTQAAAKSAGAKGPRGKDCPAAK